MSASSDFEYTRRERRRRERLRKKRIRAVIILVALIGIIVLICAAVSTCSKNNDTDENLAGNMPVETAEVPTPPPAEIKTSNIPPASEENNLLQIIADSGESKHCYLTFDDGPTENITPQILDVLRRYNVKATFFEVGSLIEANTDMARRVYEEGHLIANHSQGHNYEKLYASTETFMTEMQSCEDAIKSVMNGEDTFRLMRFPGGSYNAGDHASMKQECKEALKQNNFYYIDWNALNGDAEGKTKNASELLEYLKQTAQGYNNLIVLMHDASSKQATADALPSIIEYLAGEGYTFHRLDDIDYHAAVSTNSPAADSNDTDGNTSPAPTGGTDSGSYTTTTVAPQSSASDAPQTSQTPATLAPASTGTIVIQ